jgi:hypothetical protein
MKKHRGAAAAGAVMVMLVGLAGCSSSGLAVPHRCKSGTMVVGHSTPVVLTQPATKVVVKLGQTLAVSKRAGAARSLITKPEVDTGKAFCEDSESATVWFLVAERRGQFMFAASFASGLGTNANQVELSAVVEVH